MDDAKEKISWGLSQCDILKISDDEIEFMTGEKEDVYKRQAHSIQGLQCHKGCSGESMGRA